jgi:hypothetical protein
MRRFRFGRLGLGLGRGLGLALALAALSGCYEGWDEGQQPSTKDQTPPTPPAPKPLAYVLLQPIQLDAAAMADAGCFPKLGVRDFRATEWSLRLAATQEAMAKIADVVVTQPIAIGKGDCTLLAGVTRVAQSAEPWGANPAPTEDALNRTTVHLTLAYWEEEPPATPPAAVTQRPWTAFAKLASRGIKVASLRYFDVSNGGSGYFTDWRDAMQGDPDGRDATPIDAVDPTEAGQEARASRIDVDTQDLAAWVLGHAT